MVSREDIFRDYTCTEELGDNFEEMVFHKIRRKKRQRKVAVSSLGAFLLGGFLFLTGTLFLPEPQAPLYTRGETGVREEVLLTDYVNFAASDESNNYVIEQVGNFEQTGTI